MSVAATLRYLAVPLHMAPLLLIGTFSLLLVVAANAGIAGIPLGLILLSWFSKYSFVLMDRLAWGAVEPPVLSIEMVNPLSEQRPLVMLLTMAAYFGARAVDHRASPTAQKMTRPKRGCAIARSIASMRVARRRAR